MFGSANSMAAAMEGWEAVEGEAEATSVADAEAVDDHSGGSVAVV